MDPVTILADIGYVLRLAQIAFQTASDAAPFVSTAVSLVEGNTTLTTEQRASLLAEETVLRAQLDAASISSDSP